MRFTMPLKRGHLLTLPWAEDTRRHRQRAHHTQTDPQELERLAQQQEQEELERQQQEQLQSRQPSLSQDYVYYTRHYYNQCQRSLPPVPRWRRLWNYVVDRMWIPVFRRRRNASEPSVVVTSVWCSLKSVFWAPYKHELLRCFRVLISFLVSVGTQ